MSELAISHSAEDCRGSLAFPPVYSEELCAGFAGTRQGCTACLSVCPHEALARHRESIVIDSDLCQRCGGCVAACPTGALKRRFAPDAEIFAAIAAAIAELHRCGSAVVTANLQQGKRSWGARQRFCEPSRSGGTIASHNGGGPSDRRAGDGISRRAAGALPRCRQERGLISPQRIVDLANRLLASWGVKGLRCYLQNDHGEDRSTWKATLLPIGNKPWRPRAAAFIRVVVRNHCHGLYEADRLIALVRPSIRSHQLQKDRRDRVSEFL